MVKIAEGAAQAGEYAALSELVIPAGVSTIASSAFSGCAGLRLRQLETGVLYDEAVDVPPCRFTYEETDKLIDTGEADKDSTDAAI